MRRVIEETKYAVGIAITVAFVLLVLAASLVAMVYIVAAVSNMRTY